MSYWSDRQDQLRKVAEKDEAAIKKRLSKFYDAEFKRLDKEIAAYFQKYGENNVIEYRTLLQSLDEADRTLLMEQMDEFAEKYPQYAHLLPVRESIYRLDRLQGLQYSVYMAQANIAGYTNEQLTEYETKLAQQGLNYSMETLGFGKNFYAINAAIVKEFVDVAWCNGENFSTRIWNDTQRVAEYINRDMAQAFARGDSYDRIVKDVRRRFGVNRSNAYRLVFTEGTYVMAESSIKPFEEDFTQYEYSPILDGKTCEICRALNGKIFEISERQPGVNFPPMHPWCRCAWIPYVEDWDKWMDDYEQRHSGEQQISAQEVLEKTIDGGLNAKTLAEAEEYIKRYVDSSQFAALGVSYSGISVETANLINKAVSDVMAQYDIPKLGGVFVAKGNTKLGKIMDGAVAGYIVPRNSLVINAKAMKNLSVIAEEQDLEKKIIEKFRTNPNGVRLKSIEAQEALQASLKSNRVRVPENAEEIIHHELGHAIEKKIKSDGDIQMLKDNMKVYAENVSGYATTDFGEYIAESFASYMKGEQVIDPLLRERFEQLKK